MRFANGAEHLRVHCRLHPGVYAPWDDAERKSRRLDGFSES
ncbi:MAG TPA: hypothetical protein VHH36_09495 [Candidatus Thermoplasmatota archaeon]|nr:hypothetical protein [Candidatus Thermoplasmatota archaeon]